MNLDTV